eukprot:520684_1
MEDVIAASNSEDDRSNVETLSFSQRRAMRLKKKKKKSHRSKLLDIASELQNFSDPESESIPLMKQNDVSTLITNGNIIEDNINENEEEKMDTIDTITKQPIDEIEEKLPNEIEEKQANEIEEKVPNEVEQNSSTEQMTENLMNQNIDKQSNDRKENNAKESNNTDSEQAVKAKKFQPISNINEFEIDPSDIMSEVELLKRKVANVFNEDQGDDNNVSTSKANNFKFSETYLETTSSKFIRLLSEKNMFDQYGSENFHRYNSNLIMDKSVIYLLQNEMMSIFTLIIGIVEGVMLLSLFVVVKNTNSEFLQHFASLVYVIQFLSYIVAVLLIPYSFVIWNYTCDSNEHNKKIINKYQIWLFVVCSVALFICCMIEYPISDKIYYLYSEESDYFSVEANVNSMSSKVSAWKKLHMAKFCFLSVIWILCISFFREAKTNEKKEE